jgi:hypothetical protein
MVRYRSSKIKVDRGLKISYKKPVSVILLIAMTILVFNTNPLQLAIAVVSNDDTLQAIHRIGSNTIQYGTNTVILSRSFNPGNGQSIYNVYVRGLPS